MTKFQVVLIGVLLLLIVGAVIVFSVAKSGSATTPQLTVWGTIDDEIFNTFLQKVQEGSGKAIPVVYLQKSASTFESDFVNALASGKGPDIVLLPQDLILKEQDRLVPIPFTTYSESTFQSTFLEEGDLYLTSNSILGFPFSIDPLVMYWNRDMLSAASVATVPKYWDEFPNLVSKITTKDNSLNISKSAVALGEFSNINHAKDILSALFLQANNPIVQYSEGRLESVLGEQLGYTVPPAETAVDFYTQFSNPSLDIYSWNRSLPNSVDAFIAEDLATYFGYASELPILGQKNPNLNFDVATLPQARTSDKRITFGALQGLAIVRGTAYAQSAFTDIQMLTSAATLPYWSAVTGLPPVRRDLLSAKPGTAADSVFYDSALWSHAWLDPDKELTQDIFQDLVESISAGSARTSEAVSRAQLQLTKLLPN